jgi:hypothetical protein
MTQTILESELTPLQRLHLREVLQDLWRVQVRQITLLSLARYDDLETEDATAGMAGGGGSVQFDQPLAQARETLERLESAMRRLDDGSHGRCRTCGSAIGFAALMVDPLLSSCLRCRPPRLGRQPLETGEDNRCGG